MDDIPQPNLMTRAEAAMEKLPPHLHISIPKTHIMSEAINVCKESRDFSLCGWSTWGHKDEVDRLTKNLDDWVVKHQA